MTAEERQIWRDAYDLYDQNHLMMPSDENWSAFGRAVSDFASRHAWRDTPLARVLAEAVLTGVEIEMKQRKHMAELAAQASSVQLTMEGVPPL